MGEFLLRQALGQPVEDPRPKMQFYGQEMQDAAEGYRDTVMELLETVPGATLYIEQEVDFSEYVQGSYGTSDALIIGQNTGSADYYNLAINYCKEVINLVTGEVDVSKASSNENVMAYIKSKETGEDEAEMQRMLEEATGLKIDEEKVKEAEKKLDDGESVENLAEDVGAGGGSGSGSGSDSGSGSGSGSGGGNGSGSGADGQETTLFAVLALVMLGAAGVMFVTRKRED